MKPPMRAEQFVPKPRARPAASRRRGPARGALPPLELEWCRAGGEFVLGFRNPFGWMANPFARILGEAGDYHLLVGSEMPSQGRRGQLRELMTRGQDLVGGNLAVKEVNG